MSFPEPRQHPYLFAHTALREAVLRAPERAYAALTGEQAQGWLSGLWEATGRELDAEERLETPRFGLEAQAPGPSGWASVVIGLPEPEEVGECHMVAILYRPPAPRFLFLKHPAEVRLFVLERGFDNADGSPRAYVAEYRAEGQRVRMRDVERIGVEAFLERIMQEAFASEPGR